MAKHDPFPTRDRARRREARTKKAFSPSTFIQRSRNESSEQKAIWHQVTGAGKSHVLREFLGVTEAEQDSTRQKLEQVLDARLRTLQS